MRLAVGVLVAAFAVGLVGTTAALGQDDILEQREAVMKNNGAQAGILNGMVRGQTPFDADAAKAALQIIADDMAIFPTLFPEGGPEGNAGPAVWSDRAGFEAAAAALQQTAAAGAQSVNTLDDLQAVFPGIGGACGACHQKYRS